MAHGNAGPHVNLPSSDQAQQQNHGHVRTYQACIPCRERKVKCDLGPVDQPHDPPCQRCLRESKHCVFSSTRRKRKSEDTEGGTDSADPDFCEIRNGRKRSRADSGESLPPSDTHASKHRRHSNHSPQLRTPGGSNGKRQLRLRAVDAIRERPTSDEEDQTLSNKTAEILQQGELHTEKDGLILLVKVLKEAAEKEEARSAAKTTPATASPSRKYVDQSSPRSKAATHNSSIVASSSDAINELETSPQAIAAWSKVRFVLAGWFTPTEAIRYVNYFYEYLSPVTPITVPDFRDQSLHSRLLSEEPMLAVTILTISSRYVQLEGAGATSRGYAIHGQLWNYLQRMIDRMFWGQEQFGGGFCGAGLRKGDTTSSTPRGLRTLGTIESLLILTEWHTRALHFPPGDDNDELMVGNGTTEEKQVSRSLPSPERSPAPSLAGRKIDSWLEPCLRSDRMCWSLLANSMALAYELGVFDQVVEPKAEPADPVSRPSASQRRAENIRRLLFVYINQTSGRLSLPTMLSQEHSASLFPEHPYTKACRKFSGAALASFRRSKEFVQDLVLYFWCGLARVMKKGNRQLFPSRGGTRAIIANGTYFQLLQGYGAEIARWKQQFDECHEIPQHMRYILGIEYEYSRVYVYGLALHAVVFRCTGGSPSSRSQTGTIPGSILAKCLNDDRPFINIIVAASHNLLRCVVEGLLPGDHLKHAPVRTYFRIMSVSIVLLKTFALGATEGDVTKSLELMDRAANALSTCIVDDVHVCGRFAELLGILTERVRSRILRIALNPSASVTRAVTPSTTNDSCRKQCRQLRSTKRKPQMISPIAQVVDCSTNGYMTQQTPTSLNSAQTQQSTRFAPTSSFISDPQYQTYQISPYSGEFNHSTHDPTNPRVSIMPPPLGYPFSASVLGGYDRLGYVSGECESNSTGQSGTGGNAQMVHDRNNYLENPPCSPGFTPGMDWLALPLDPLLSFSANDVTTTGSFGPDVGGHDMLDVLLRDQNTNGCWENGAGW